MKSSKSKISYRCSWSRCWWIWGFITTSRLETCLDWYQGVHLGNCICMSTWPRSWKLTWNRCVLPELLDSRITSQHWLQLSDTQRQSACCLLHHHMSLWHSIHMSMVSCLTNLEIDSVSVHPSVLVLDWSFPGFFMYPVPISIVGFLIFMFTDSFGARYFSTFLFIFVFAINGTLYSWIAGAIPRPRAKRAAAYAFINSIGNSASIWTSFTYRPQDAPHYRPALGICIALQGVAALLGVWLRIILQRENKRLDRMQNEDVQLTEKDLAKLKKTADFEGIDLAAARRLQKTYRYMIWGTSRRLLDLCRCSRLSLIIRLKACMIRALEVESSGAFDIELLSTSISSEMCRPVAHLFCALESRLCYTASKVIHPGGAPLTPGVWEPAPPRKWLGYWKMQSSESTILTLGGSIQLCSIPSCSNSINWTSNTLSPTLLDPFSRNLIIMPDTIQAQQHSTDTRTKSHPICPRITSLSLQTFPIPSLLVQLRMRIVDPPVDQIEDVSRDDRSKCHCPPILTQSVNTKCMSNDTRINTKQHSISESSKSGNRDKQDRIGDTQRSDLCTDKDDARDEQTPESTEMLFPHQKIWANAG